MPSIPFVGKCFATADSFMAYLETIQFGAWRPRFIVLHHTGAPTLRDWTNWQGRVSDEQWMKNLASYYGNSLGWRSGPQFFFTPKHYCVLSLPNKIGVHAAAFNSASWGVEVTGYFDTEPFEGVIRERTIEGLACLHIAAGLTPDFAKNVRGLHFHRDDPTTSKTCPGTKVQRDPLIAAVKAKMAEMTQGDHPDEAVIEDETAAKPPPPAAPPDTKIPEGVVKSPDGSLNLREMASAKAPLIVSLQNGTRVAIIGEAMNGPTKWLKVWMRVAGIARTGWVAAQFVELDK